METNIRQTMRHSIILRILFVWALFIVGGPICIAQISEYQECSDGLDITSLIENLTAEERIAIMDAHFNDELSDTERCEVGDSGASGGASGSGSSAGGAGGGGSGNGSPANPNSLKDGERSVALNSDMTPSSALAQSEGSPGPGVSGNNGREHEALASADNKKALAESILKRAEQEDDPVIKEALMKRYKELTQ